MAALAAAGGVCVLGLAGYAMAGSMTVSLTDDGPSPATATVAVGDTVLFAGVGRQNHAIIAPSFTIPLIHPGETYPIKMVVPGRVSYQATGFGKPFRGSIIVVIPGGLELKASRTAVPYGQPVTLSGSTPLKNDEVVLESRPTGRSASGASWGRVVGVPTGADGSFSTVVQPEASTSYRVAYGADKVRSQSVNVDVLPVLTLSATPRTLKTGAVLHVTGKVVPSNAATSLDLAQYDPKRKTRPWRSVLQKAVGSTGTVVFDWTVTPGRSLLRVQTSRSTSRPGFVASTSRYIVVTGLGQAQTQKARATKKRKKLPPSQRPKKKKHHPASTQRSAQ